MIVNTCAVTAEAERQARQATGRLRRERPQARIIVTGCAAQVDSASFSAMPEVDRVIGNQEKLKAETWTGAEPVAVGDITSYGADLPGRPSLGQAIPHLGDTGTNSCQPILAG